MRVLLCAEASTAMSDLSQPGRRPGQLGGPEKPVCLASLTVSVQKECNESPFIQNVRALAGR